MQDINDIQDLSFSTRVYNVFKINNITLEDIFANKYSLSDLYCLPNIGKRSIKEIKETFILYNYFFRDQERFMYCETRD